MENIKNFLSGRTVTMALEFTPAEVAVIDGGAVVAVIKNDKGEVKETFVDKEPEWSEFDAAQCACEAELLRTLAKTESEKANVIITDKLNRKVGAVIDHLRADPALTCVKGPNTTAEYAVRDCCRTYDWATPKVKAKPEVNAKP